MRKIVLPLLAITLLYRIGSAQTPDFNITLRGQVSYPYSCSSIWGYVDSSGNEYALVGTDDGVSIVNVNDADNPAVVFNVSHQPSFWREIKTYGHYAYATNEDGGGLLVIDLSGLPNSYTQSSFIYTDAFGNMQSDGHTLWIDENGRLYIFGGGYDGKGATMFDLTADPVNPPFVGKYENHYIHDGFVRGDTLWASEIYSGELELVDVSDPANPVPLASVFTPSFFTHNSWPTHDDNYVFTTDEVTGSFLTSYDVSDLSNITELDRAQSNPGSGSIVHNVHLYNDDFAVTAYYRDGVVIWDVSHPDNIIEAAAFDTYPTGNGTGYNGTWGVYPYLPSGIIIASNIESGLIVLSPEYVLAGRLEGTITDTLGGAPVNNVKAEILSTSDYDNSDLSGVYKTGTHAAGTYSILFTKGGYLPKQIDNVTLVGGQVTTLDVQLYPVVPFTLTGIVTDSTTGAGIPGALVSLQDGSGIVFNVTADVNGNFQVTNFPSNYYSSLAGHWGYRTKQNTNLLLTDQTGTLTIPLGKGYYDDFSFYFGWNVSSNAATGSWVRDEPIGTEDGGIPVNPDEDISTDFRNQCYMTGNGGGNAGDDDVDNGITTLTSPVFNLTDYNNPKISYYRWFENAGGSSSPNDSLRVILNNGSTGVIVETISAYNAIQAQWNYHEFYVTDFMTPTSTMTIQFTTADQAATPHLVEAAIDLFQVSGAVVTNAGDVSDPGCTSCIVYPNPFSDEVMILLPLNEWKGKSVTAEVYNALGEKIRLVDVKDEKTLVGGDLKNGVYFIVIKVDGEVKKTFPVIKEN